MRIRPGKKISYPSWDNAQGASIPLSIWKVQATFCCEDNCSSSCCALDDAIRLDLIMASRPNNRSSPERLEISRAKGNPAAASKRLSSIYRPASDAFSHLAIVTSDNRLASVILSASSAIRILRSVCTLVTLRMTDSKFLGDLYPRFNLCHHFAVHGISRVLTLIIGFTRRQSRE